MLRRFARYMLLRTAVLLLTVVASVYVTILAVNLGGYVDNVVRSRIDEAVRPPANTPEMLALTPAQRVAVWEQMVAAAEEAAGLNESFLVRSFRFLKPVLTLDLGQSSAVLTGKLAVLGRGLFDNSLIILDRIPATLLLLGLTSVFTFLSSVYLGLRLSQGHNRLLGRAVVVLSSFSAMPPWFYGLFLIAIFGGVLPTSGMYPSPPPDSKLMYALSVAGHMLLPSLAIFLSTFFYSVNTWRTFFLVYSDEDYVELARAKGLTHAMVRRRYILRPTLPAILTSFSLTLLGVWSGSVVLEILFGWPGLGQLYYSAIVSLNTGLILGLTVIYAYFLGITLFLLDIANALVDPRIRIGSQADTLQNRAIARRPAASLRWRRATSPLQPRVMPRLDIRQAVRHLTNRSARLIRDIVRLRLVVRELGHYPWALAGLLIIGALGCVAVYAVIALPFDDAVTQWRTTTNPEVPRNARPTWFNTLSRTKLPGTIILDSRDGQAEKRVEAFAGGKEIILTYSFDYPYDAFPQELNVQFDIEFAGRPPHVELSWLTPDGRAIRIGEMAPARQEMYRISQDTRLMRRLGGALPEKGLFLNPDVSGDAPLKGAYRLRISGLFFEEPGDLDARFVVLGQVYGLAGTDHTRRDLMVGLLWGTPTALAFGLLGALLTGLGTMLIAAIGAWFGGVIDAAIQSITEINLALPAFPILAMIAHYYTPSIWGLLAAAVLLNIFGSPIKTYRAILLQARTAPYIAAAQAYGAGSARIIGSYLIPRIAQVLIPQMVILVPFYVFLEAALAFVGQSDPVLPTWGKIIHDAHVNSALLNGHHYWILLPAVLLLLVSLAFALVASDLERILNPKLRDV